MKQTYKLIFIVLLLLGLCVSGVQAAYVSQYPPEFTQVYVNASNAGDRAPPATNPSLSLIGHANLGWMTDVGYETNQRLHIDLGSAKNIVNIYYENFHYDGSLTERGVKNFTFWGTNSSDAFINVNSTTGWTQLSASVPGLDQHIAADQADPKYFNVTNTGTYRYYALSATNGWGSTQGIGLRRIELRSDVNPIASFGSFNAEGTAPFTTYLYDTSTNLTGSETFGWVLGDGNTSTAKNLYFTWNATGEYTVSHSVSDGVTTSYSQANVTVGTPTPAVIAPVASFYGSPTTGNVPLTVSFTDVSANSPTSWFWEFGDGANSTLQNPTHAYNRSGFRTVNLTATNSAGSNITVRLKFVRVS